MKRVFNFVLALFAASLILAAPLSAQISAPALAPNAAPSAAAGKAVWEGQNTYCANCHGKTAEGGFGPTLAGRGLSAAAVQKAVRTPAGIMPSFVFTQFSDADLANLAAYFASLAKPAAQGPWRIMPDAKMPPGQQLLVTMGCAQCHGPFFEGPRGLMGGVGGNFATFEKLVYTHTADTLPIYATLGAGNPALAPDKGGPTRAGGQTAPPLRMGNFNPARVTPAQLKQIYDWARSDIGFRPLLQGRISKGATGPRGVTYTVELANNGVKGKGMAGEGVTVDLTLPSGNAVIGATGDGYQGVHRDAQAKADVARWQVPRMVAKDKKIFTLTLSAPATPANNLKGNIVWTKPAPKSGTYKDAHAIAPPMF